MTKIAYIHGIPATTAANEAADRAVSVAKTYVPVGLASPGEAYLDLVRQEAAILAAYYPEDKQLKKALTIIENGLTSGLNKQYWGFASSYSVSQAAKAIRTARAMNAANHVAVSGIYAQHGIGLDPIIIQENCAQYAVDQPGNPSQGVNDPDYIRCLQINYWAPVLNQHLESSGHYPLYNFHANPADMTATGATKRLTQIGGIQGIAQDTQLPTALIGQWYRTAIVRKNASLAAIGANQPEYCIDALKQYQNEGVGIGAIPLVVLLPLITKLVIAIAAAASAIAALVAACKNAKPQGSIANNPAFGLPAYQAGAGDFPLLGAGGGGNNNNGGGGSQDSDNTMLYLGGAAALLGGFLLLNDKK